MGDRRVYFAMYINESVPCFMKFITGGDYVTCGLYI